jgi:hypothetical protein
MAAVKTAMQAVPIANIIAIMIRDYCGRVRVEIAEPNTPTDFRVAHADTFRRDRSSRFPAPTLFLIGNLIP